MVDQSRHPDSGSQTRMNLILNVARLGVNIGLGLFYTSYLVKGLGIVAYGILPLALILNQYVNVLAGSLTTSLTRFYAVAIHEHKRAEASRYLSSAIVAIAALLVLLLPLLAGVVLRIDWLFNIPAGHVDDARILFSLMILSFMMSLFSSLFGTTLYAANRLDLMNVVNIIRIVSRVSCTVLFFEGFSRSIVFVGYANVVAEVIVLLTSISLFRRTSDPGVRISPRLFEVPALLSVLSMAIWIFVHFLGNAALYSFDTVIVNKFWGLRESGVLGALTELNGYVESAMSVLGTLFGPLILIAYSQKRHEQVRTLTIGNAFLLGCLTSVLVGVLIGFAEPILSLWLGHEYVQYTAWFILKVVTVPFALASSLYVVVYKAWNRVALPAIVTLVIGLFNGIGAYIICSMSGGSQEYITALLVLATTSIIIQGYVLNAYCFRSIYREVSGTALFKVFFQTLCFLVLTALVGTVYVVVFDVSTVLRLAIGCILVGSVSLALGTTIILDRHQREMVWGYVKHGAVM